MHSLSALIAQREEGTFNNGKTFAPHPLGIQSTLQSGQPGDFWLLLAAMAAATSTGRWAQRKPQASQTGTRAHVQLPLQSSRSDECNVANFRFSFEISRS